jgi:G3E family GTPase
MSGTESGFAELFSGKTTLIRELLARPEGANTALVAAPTSWRAA